MRCNVKFPGYAKYTKNMIAGIKYNISGCAAAHSQVSVAPPSLMCEAK